MAQTLQTINSATHPRRRQILSPQRWIGFAVVLIVSIVVLRRLLPNTTHQIVPPWSSGTAHNAQAVPVSVQSAAETISPQSLEVTGAVRSELESPIASKVMARVQNVLVRAGDHVHRGQPLILLDARDLDASISQANANLRAARVGYDNARVAARMEASLSAARIAEAQSKIGQSEAALQAATARLELVQAGPRPQEREQAVLAVAQAKSNLTLAESNMKRMAELYRGDAISAQQYEQYRSQYEVAKSQFETAQQGKSISDEGSRTEDIRAAQQAVRQAQAAVQEAHAGLKSAQASAMQTEVRKQEIQGAQAQIGQSQAGLQLAQVARDYATLSAPFDGIVTKRLADPGVMAGPGVPLITIQGGSLRLEAIVPESVLSSVSKGAAVPVAFDALRNRALTGRVVEIAPQGDASSHTFVVKIDLPLGSGASAGMFGRARFTTGTEKRLLVPASALWERDGLHYIYVVDENRVARLRMVTVGDPVGERVPVLSGLNLGERIVTTGRERLTDGSPVTEESR
jgi:RND family efflux transporter MFP subunit